MLKNLPLAAPLCSSEITLHRFELSNANTQGVLIVSTCESRVSHSPNIYYIWHFKSISRGFYYFLFSLYQDTASSRRPLKSSVCFYPPTWPLSKRAGDFFLSLHKYRYRDGKSAWSSRFRPRSLILPAVVKYLRTLLMYMYICMGGSRVGRQSRRALDHFAYMSAYIHIHVPAGARVCPQARIDN